MCTSLVFRLIFFFLPILCPCVRLIGSKQNWWVLFEKKHFFDAYIHLYEPYRYEFVLLSIYYELYCFQLYHYYCIKWEMKCDQSSVQVGWDPRKSPGQSPAHSMSCSEVRPDCSGQSQKLPASLGSLFCSLAVLRKDHIFLASDLSISLDNFCVWVSAFHYALLCLSLGDFSSFQHVRKGNFSKKYFAGFVWSRVYFLHSVCFLDHQM